MLLIAFSSNSHTRTMNLLCGLSLLIESKMYIILLLYCNILQVDEFATVDPTHEA